MAKRSALCALDEPTPTARTLIEHTYAQLRDDIVTGRLLPGEKLRVEHLKARYGVSAGTLREAITRLASDALVATEDGGQERDHRKLHRLAFRLRHKRDEKAQPQ